MIRFITDIFRISLVIVFLLFSFPNGASESATVLGTTPAMECFLESRYSVIFDSLAPCNEAIKKGQLSRIDLAATYSNRGLIFSKLGQQEKALKDHNKALQLRPNLAGAYINRGNTYFRLRLYHEALEDYTRALTLENGAQHLAHYNAGLTYLKIKDYELARNELEKALELAPENVQIRSKFEALKPE